MLELLRDYSFWTVALGTLVLALAASQIGTISVLTRQSLIGDSLGHAAYPGIILSYMVFQSRQPLLLLLGAVGSGYLSYGLVGWLCRRGRTSRVNALALVSAAFFGLGLVLKQYVQGNVAFQGTAQAGLENYVFGQAAFMQLDDVLLICLVALLGLFLFGWYYQSLKLYLFDRQFAKLVGIPVEKIDRLTLFLLLSLIAVGLKVVGAILMSSFLIAPAVFGLLLGKSYGQTLALAAGIASFSALVGTYLSSVVTGLSTGPTIIVCLSVSSLVAFAYVTYIRKENVHA
ncbi:metal ABC transporter permease [Streptococcus suis]|uniref:metal ABC transporter permease n=1 Tax=Streptococcus suis TaxID=1307 RepID=UPI000CF671B0|nr:metal ABC transporter permease [Streptococcus suis]